jgi:hypothetical protein
MTLAERSLLEGRIERLEDALIGYMDAVDKLSFTVEGDMRHDFLTAYAGAMAALPTGKWPSVRRGVRVPEPWEAG